MVRLVAARKKGPFEIEINYKDHELSFRSIEGAKMASSLGSPDLSELVECYANYLLSSMAKPNSKERKRPINIIDDDMFSKVKQRSNSFTQLIKDTVDTEPLSRSSMTSARSIQACPLSPTTYEMCLHHASFSWKACQFRHTTSILSKPRKYLY